MNKNCILLLSLLLSGSVFAGYAEVVSADAPAAWWRFDDYMYKDGFAAKEATGNFSASTFQGDAMTVDAGIDGKCGWFNGNKAGIDIGNFLGAMLNGSSAVTVEMWLRNSVLPQSNLVQRLFATRIDAGKAGIDIGVYTYSGSPSVVRFGGRSTASDSYLSTPSAPFTTTSQWVHLVCISDYAAKKVQFYINGVLAQETAVSFLKNYYDYGTPSQRDSIGRAPDNTVPYRGYLDEVAVYNKALTPSQIQAHFAAGNPQEPGALWVSEIAYLDASTGRLLGSPSLLLYNDGVMLCAHNNWGDTVLKLSYDNGRTWLARSVVEDFVMATLFEHDGVTYLFGITRNPGHICMAKTTNRGQSWSATKVLFQADLPGTYGYHTGPVPVILSNGRIYRVFEKRVTDERWPIAYAAAVVWADAQSDLMNPASWTMTNPVPFDPAWANPAWNCTSPGWLEGNIVEAPDGKPIVLMRYHTNPVVDKAAILTLSQNDTVLTFDPQTGVIDMPGGMHKFDIRRDPVTGVYLTLNNNNTDLSRPAQRNTLSLVGSKDLRNWYHIRTVLQDNSSMTWQDSLVNIGFQYVVWTIDGDDIIYMSRTSYDGAYNYHDSNRMTFHRLENYLDFVAPCGQWGYFPKDLNLDCKVDFDDLMIISDLWLGEYDYLDFTELSDKWLECTKPYRAGCSNILE